MTISTVCLSLLAGLSLLALGGCGTGSMPAPSASAAPAIPSTKPPAVVNPLHATYQALVTDRSALFDRRKLLNKTPEPAMPTTGVAIYDGIGSVGIETATQSFMALGNAAIRVNFGNSKMSGTMDNFIGRDLSDVEQAFSGTLVVLGDVGAGTMRTNQFALVVGGTLISPDQTIKINNDLTGGFRGPAYNTIFATTAAGDSVLVNGTATPAAVQIIAER